MRALPAYNTARRLEKQMNRCSRFSGRCGCSEVRYGLRNPPLFVHACHCLDCQKASGSAFRITTIVLERDIVISQGDVSFRKISTQRTEFICKSCGDVIYGTATNHPATALLNTRTLDDPRMLEIGAHIWTVDRHPWLVLPTDVPQYEKGYERNEVWPQENLQRLRRAVDEGGRI